MSEKRKRDRSENWTEQERKILLHLIEPRIDIIEAKQTDTQTNMRKQLEWGEVEERFEQMANGVKRSKAQLKEQWKRLKSLARKKILTYKKCQKESGAGANTVVVTEIDWKIKNLLPHEFEKGSNKYENDDDDDDNESQDPDETQEMEFIEITHQTPMNRASNLASESDYHQLLTKKKVEELDLKLRHMKEIHELEIEHRKLQIKKLELEIAQMNKYKKLDIS